MAACHLLCHALQAGTAAAPHVQHTIIRFKSQMAQRPPGERSVTVVHAGEHLRAGFAFRFVGAAFYRNFPLFRHIVTFLSFVL
jgi:hypothetical protein